MTDLFLNLKKILPVTLTFFNYPVLKTTVSDFNIFTQCIIFEKFNILPIVIRLFAGLICIQTPNHKSAVIIRVNTDFICKPMNEV